MYALCCVYVLSHLTPTMTLWNRHVSLSLYVKTFMGRELNWFAQTHNY